MNFLLNRQKTSMEYSIPHKHKISYKKMKKFLITYVVAFFIMFIGAEVMATAATTTEMPNGDESAYSLGIQVDTNNDEGTMSGTIQMLLVITVISLAPSIIVMMTSFTRIIVVLHFLRTALGTQTAPPNNVLIGLSLFLTLFIMSPTFSRVNEEGLKPLAAGEITQEEALDACMDPMRDFMLDQVKEDDLKLFMDIAHVEAVESVDDIPTNIVIPAFIISELRAAFIIGFLIYIPFIIIDMVVASTLMAMGMMMLPPTTISMPFKILLFILADGWNLVIGQVVKSFIT